MRQSMLRPFKFGPVLLFLLIAGCTTTEVRQPTFAYHPSTPVAANPPREDPGLTATLNSELEVMRAAAVMTKCFENFGYHVEYHGEADYFSATLHANSGDVTKVLVAIHWKKGGYTEITVTSHLEKDQFDEVVNSLRAALAAEQPN